MRAIQATRFGGPEVLTVKELPDPAAGPGQAVLAVSAADVLFMETQIRQGAMNEHFSPALPYVPGGAVAGRVLSVGEGVDESWTGRRVVARTEGLGGYAERAVVAAEALIPVPDALESADAAALLHDGPTALALLDGAALRPGASVLVTAAGGGLGILLVQLAKAAGARVVAAARGERKLALLREIGADAVVDYSVPGWAEQAREAVGGAGADVVFEGAGGEIGLAAFGVTAPGGRFSAHGAPSGDFAPVDAADAKRDGVTLVGIEQVQLDAPTARLLTRRALDEAAAGRMRPVVGQTFALTRAADAHRAIEARGTTGKTLLLV